MNPTESAVRNSQGRGCFSCNSIQLFIKIARSHSSSSKVYTRRLSSNGNKYDQSSELSFLSKNTPGAKKVRSCVDAAQFLVIPLTSFIAPRSIMPCWIALSPFECAVSKNSVAESRREVASRWWRSPSYRHVVDTRASDTCHHFRGIPPEARLAFGHDSTVVYLDVEGLGKLYGSCCCWWVRGDIAWPGAL